MLGFDSILSALRKPLCIAEDSFLDIVLVAQGDSVDASSNTNCLDILAKLLRACQDTDVAQDIRFFKMLDEVIVARVVQKGCCHVNHVVDLRM